MATLESRGNSVRVNWRLGGSRHGARQSCTFQGTPVARMKLAQIAKLLVESRGHNITRAETYAAVLGEQPVDDLVPTFSTWVELWLAERARMRDIQPDTIANYRWVLTARAVPRFGHLRLTDIDPEVIKEWVAWMASRRATAGNRNRNTAANRLLAASTIGKAYRILHSCLGAAVPQWLPANPAALPQGARKHASRLPKAEPFEGMFLRPAEVRVILANCGPEIYDLVCTALATGMRLGELVALEAQHVTFNGRQTVVHVRQTLKGDGTVGVPKSAASRRSIPVADDAGEMLQARVAGKRPTALVFPAPHQGRWTEDNFRKQYWWPAVAAAQRCAEHPPAEPVYGGRGRRPQLGMHDVSSCDCAGRVHRRPRPHDLRHTHASALIQAGWSPKKVQVRLGHSNYLITMNTYAHLWDLGNEDELRAVAQLMLPERVNRHPGRPGSVPRRGRRVRGRSVLVRR